MGLKIPATAAWASHSICRSSTGSRKCATISALAVVTWAGAVHRVQLMACCNRKKRTQSRRPNLPGAPGDLDTSKTEKDLPILRYYPCFPKPQICLQKQSVCALWPPSAPANPTGINHCVSACVCARYFALVLFPERSINREMPRPVCACNMRPSKMAPLHMEPCYLVDNGICGATGLVLILGTHGTGPRLQQGSPASLVLQQWLCALPSCSCCVNLKRSNPWFLFSSRGDYITQTVLGPTSLSESSGPSASSAISRPSLLSVLVLRRSDTGKQAGGAPCSLLQAALDPHMARSARVLALQANCVSPAYLIEVGPVRPFLDLYQL